MRKYRALMFAKYHGEFKRVPKKFWKDKAFVLEVVEEDGHALEYASKELRNDKEVVLEAVKEDGYALQYASEELKNDKEFVLAAVKRNSESFVFVPYKLMEEKEFRDLIIEAAKEYFKDFVEEASKEGVGISKINETLGYKMEKISKAFEEKRKECEQRKNDLKAIDDKINNFVNDLGKE